MKTAIITGATSGIGEACAKRLASEGWRLIITGRREEKLNKLATELNNSYNTEILPLIFDVRDEEQTIKHLGNLPENWKDIDLLINNAGLASGLEPIQDGDTEDWNKMIDTNVKGLLYVSKQIMPLMKKKQERPYNQPRFNCRKRGLSKRSCILRHKTCGRCNIQGNEA
jgi:Short-chain alcohol dehydrogenase of unknown specificity